MSAFEQLTKTGKIAYKAKSERPKLLSRREGRLIERKSLLLHDYTSNKSRISGVCREEGLCTNWETLVE